MRKKILQKLVLGGLLLSAYVVNGSGVDVDGVFGLAPVLETASIAVWVPLEDGQAVEGIKWFNNDGLAVFPRIRALAGDVDRPEILTGAVVVAENVSGANSSWSEVAFFQPLASETEGIYLVFEVPEDGEFVAEGEGGGHGLGYEEGDGQIRCWISADEGVWDALSPNYQMAVETMPVSDKSGNVLVLSPQSADPGETTEEPLSSTSHRAPAVVISPNPFNPATEIHFSLHAGSQVVLDVYDLRGRVVRNLINDEYTAGDYSVGWDGRDNAGRQVASGTYFARINIGNRQLVQKMTLLK